MARIARAWLRLVIWVNAHCKSAAVRLTKMTGKSAVPIHPKHLIRIDVNQHWYAEGVEAGTRVLDLGCGNGMHGIYLASRGAGVVGVDADMGLLRIGQLLGAQQGAASMSFSLGDVELPLPFRTGQFDLVLLLDVIEHLHRRQELLQEIHRVLRLGGKLLLSAPNRDTSWKRRLSAVGLSYYTDPDHKIEYAWDELRAELRGGGFVYQDTPMTIVYDSPWAGLFDLVGGFSLGLYSCLAQWKVRMAHHHPQETIGWRTVCERVDL